MQSRRVFDGLGLLDKDPRASLYAFEGEDYQLRVKPVADESFSCYYKFASAQDMYEKSTAAVDLTVTKLAANPISTKP